MRIIRITTDNEISVHGFPDGAYKAQNLALRTLIGPDCGLYEHVMPKRLYEVLGASNRLEGEKGSCISMLVDEEGLYHELATNIVGSYLYEADKHGCVIKGNILIIGEMATVDGIEFCGMSDEQFELLYPKLEQLTEKARNSI